MSTNRSEGGYDASKYAYWPAGQSQPTYPGARSSTAGGSTTGSTVNTGVSSAGGNGTTVTAASTAQAQSAFTQPRPNDWEMWFQFGPYTFEANNVVWGPRNGGSDTNQGGNSQGGTSQGG